MPKWWIGCSGFHYKEWKEVFYPKGLAQSKWFDYYAQHFNTLEINNTFYRFPDQKLFDNWYRKAPLDRVSALASQLLSRFLPVALSPPPACPRCHLPLTWR